MKLLGASCLPMTVKSRVKVYELSAVEQLAAR